MSDGRPSEPDDWNPPVTVRFPERLLERLDQAVEDGHYSNRSEAIRAAIRQMHLGEP